MFCCVSGTECRFSVDTCEENEWVHDRFSVAAIANTLHSKWALLKDSGRGFSDLFPHFRNRILLFSSSSAKLLVQIYDYNDIKQFYFCHGTSKNNNRLV